MRCVKILFLILCLMLPMEALASETAEEAIKDEWLQQFDFTEIEEIVDEIFPEEKLGFVETVGALIDGELEFSLELIKHLIADQLFYEVKASRSGMIQILILVIVAAVFSNFSSMFKNTQVAEISFMMLYMLLLTICLDSFRILTVATGDNVEKLIHFMEVLGPVYFMAVAMATGSVTSVAFYQIILLVIYIIEILILGFLLPVTKIYVIIRILSEMSTELHLSKFAELLETIVSWTLKTLVAGVVGLNVIQGLISPAVDSVKRSVLTRGGEAIPIIGDAIGGVTEVVLGTAVLIKNGIGVVGMVFCLIICLAPIIQMGVATLMYQLLSALMQPISDKRMVNCVSSMADGMKMLLRIVMTSGVLFLLTIAVVAATAGG